jgi:hypothetical protein
VLVFYVPMIVFFTWIVVMSVLALRAINAEAAAGQSVPAEKRPGRAAAVAT